MAEIEHAFTTWPWQHWTQERPNEVALSFGDTNVTWLQLSCKIEGFAAGLIKQGVRRDDVVVAIADNRIELIWLHLATLRVGARFVALPKRVADKPLAEKLETLCATYLWLEQTDRITPKGCQRLELISATQCVIPVTWQPARAATVVFTSGSTGKAKAVVHSINNHLYSAVGLLTMMDFTKQDAWLLSLPLSHVSGLAIVWRWLMAGGELVLCKKGELLNTVVQVTHASLVPSQLQRLLQDIPIDGRARLKQVLLGGTAIPVELVEQAKRQGIECWVGYGLTEMASTVVAKRADATAGVGQVIPNRQIRLRDQEIQVKGKSLCLGYLVGNKILSMVDDDGWFATKDLARAQKGELFIIGRKDNMFISGGENIHPEEIESVLLSHPSINRAIVIAVDHKEYGHRPVAVIESSIELDREQVNHFLDGKLDKIKWPERYYSLPDELALAEVKVNRNQVKSWLLTQR
jgi:O-succinylbenzoic acid--CoA ligase